MRVLDHTISILDGVIPINEIINPKLAWKQKTKRASLDAQRKQLRLWMKGYMDTPTFKGVQKNVNA